MSNAKRSAIRTAFGAMAAACATLVVHADVAGASPPWSAPQVIPGAQLASWFPYGPYFSAQGFGGLLGFTSAGEGAAIVQLVDRAPVGQRYALARYSASQQAFGPMVPSDFAGISPARMTMFARDGAFVAGGANRASDPHQPRNWNSLPLDVAVARGSLSGAFAQRQVLGKGLRKKRSATVAALAANRFGDAAIVVSVPRADGDRVRVVARLFVRRRGAPRFEHVADLGRPTYAPGPAAVALDDAGDVLAAWDDHTVVSAVLVRASGKVGRPQRLGVGGSAFADQRISAAIDDTGRMLVGWLAQKIGGTFAGGANVVALASAMRGRSFGPMQVVQHVPRGLDMVIPGTAVQVALRGGRGVMAWTGFSHARYTVRAADIVSGRATAPTDLSPRGHNGRLLGMAAGPRGALVVTWASSSVTAGPSPVGWSPIAIQAAVRPADGARWGPAEDVATIGLPTQEDEVDRMESDALIAIDPVSGQAVVLFSDEAVSSSEATPQRTEYSVRPTG